MMQTNVAVAPFPAVDRARLSAQIGEVVPRVAAAWTSSRIAPVVIFHTVGREVNIAALGTARIFQVVASETLEQVGIAARALKDSGENRFGAVPHIFKHFAYTALKVEAHDH